MSTGTRLPLHHAHRVATRVVEALRPACERIEIAGSIRRQTADVGDIEIVCMPKLEQGVPVALFEAAPSVSALDALLARLLASGMLAKHPERPAAGDRYKRLWLPRTGVQLDLFIVLPPAEWGPILAIRTGPAPFSKRLVEALRGRGWRCEEGRVLDRYDDVVSCPEESDFLQACGVPWAEPEER